MSALVEQVRAVRRLPSPSMRRAIRLSAGVSMRQIGDHVGVSRAAVGHWEAGRWTPSPEHAARYADLLDELRDAVAA